MEGTILVQAELPDARLPYKREFRSCQVHKNLANRLHHGRMLSLVCSLLLMLASGSSLVGLPVLAYFAYLFFCNVIDIC